MREKIEQELRSRKSELVRVSGLIDKGGAGLKKAVSVARLEIEIALLELLLKED
jgi:hypothetical protein